jgi:hypothetical protein
MAIKSDMTKIGKRFNATKRNVSSTRGNTFLLATSLLTVGCKSSETQSTAYENTISQSEDNTVSIILSEGQNYSELTSSDELLSADYSIFSTINEIIDSDPSDEDTLTVVTNEDILVTPTVKGIESLIFKTSDNYTDLDDSFSIDLAAFTSFKEIILSKDDEDLQIQNLELNNASGNIIADHGFVNVTVTGVSSEDVQLQVQEDASILVGAKVQNLVINGTGNSIDLDTSNQGNIEILDNSSVILQAPNAIGDLILASNGNAEITDASSLIGNATVSAIGSIDIDNISALEGKLSVENMRALAGMDINISNATNAKSVEIKTVGAVIIASDNGGLNEAENIKITSSEDSIIIADKDIPRKVELEAVSANGELVAFDLNINGLTNLGLGGTSPILINSEGSALDGVTVTSSNSTTTSLNLTSADMDLSGISNTVQIQLENLDGKKLTLGANQLIALNAEHQQTSNTNKPELNFTSDATSLTSNSITIKTIDSDTSNTTSSVSCAGLNTTDIQYLNFDLSSGVDFQSTSDITGSDLLQITVLGDGNFSLSESTIVGGLNNAVTMTATDMTGNLNVLIDNTSNGIKNVSSGTGDDIITIDGTNQSSAGVVVNSNGGSDTISLTSNSDGSLSKISLNGGSEIDQVNFESELDFSLSDLTLTNIEILNFTGGTASTKIPSDVVSTKSYILSKSGSNTLSIELIPKAQTVDLSSLTFDSSFVVGSDVIIIDGTNFGQALNVTGTISNDEITGTHSSGDTISSGDGDDTLYGRDGNDTLTPGNGEDHVIPGMGNDTINLSEEISSRDTLSYTVDDGANNVDTVSGFDVRIVDDIISLDVSELSSPITLGNGTATSTTSIGNILIKEHTIDTDLNYSSNSTATIFKLTATDQSEFADALGTSSITVADGSSLNFLWYDADTNETVYGYASENTTNEADNLITADDTFVEIVRISMSENSYTHYLDTNNFVFL